MSQKDLTKIIPYGDLAIIPLESSRPIGEKVDALPDGAHNLNLVHPSISPTTKRNPTSLMLYVLDLAPVKQREF